MDTPQMNRLYAGDLAPRAQFSNPQDETVLLEDLWSQRPVLLEFLRHFG